MRMNDEAARRGDAEATSALTTKQTVPRDRNDKKLAVLLRAEIKARDF
jgi:hypothetical protein